MYNLMMVGSENYWTEIPLEGKYEVSRFLEYTHQATRKIFSSLTDAVIEKLLQLPTLFAYKFHVESPVYVGRITHIARGAREIAFNYELDENIPPITMESIKRIASDLDIDVKGLETYRTHWAIKDVDLLKVLFDAGLATAPLQSAQIKEVETLVAEILADATSKTSNILALIAVLVDSGYEEGLRRGGCYGAIVV